MTGSLCFKLFDFPLKNFIESSFVKNNIFTASIVFIFINWNVYQKILFSGIGSIIFTRRFTICSLFLLKILFVLQDFLFYQDKLEEIKKSYGHNFNKGRVQIIEKEENVMVNLCRTMDGYDARMIKKCIKVGEQRRTSQT